MDAPTNPAVRTACPSRLRAGLWMLAACAALAVAGCDTGTGPLAPYDGGRALDLLKVTQSFTPEIQWVGGRVAAVGVNRGTRAALDSTLVWMQEGSGNTISSFSTVGLQTAAAQVASYGGTLQERLTDGETYTFWIAEQSALDVGLDPTRIDTTAFADTTLTMQLLLRGQRGGDPSLNVQFEIERNERLTGETFIVRWTPSNVRFRHLAIRQASTGGFTELAWYVHSPDAGPSIIAPPVTLSETPEGVELVNEFPGFSRNTYFLWAATDGWNGSFSPSSPGYAWFRILSSNFPETPTNP